MLSRFQKTLSDFWKQQPALHVGLALLFGAAYALAPIWILVLLLPLLFSNRQYTTTAMIIACASYAYTLWICPKFDSAQEAIQGTAYLHIENLTVQASPFHKSYLYKGKILHFISKEEIHYNLPCSLYLPLKKSRPSANCDYMIQGTLRKKRHLHWQFKPDKNSSWEPIPNTWSLAEYRFQAKEKVARFLKEQIPHPKSASFLTTLATGDIDDRTLSLEFGKMGMQHILAISGFHFALIAAFLSFFLRLFLKPKYSAFLLIFLLSTYFVFIGNAPSVCRAWIAISLFLIAQGIGLRLSGLNALGVGLIVEILCDPLLILHIGFQLSFLATLSILLLYPLINRLVSYFLPRRPLSNLVLLGKLDQHVYLIGALLRKAISLNLTVHLATAPLLLFLFHKFPLLSLVYNLFFPFVVSLSLLLLLLSCLASLLLPPLGSLLHTLNSSFTSSLLVIVEHPPALFDYQLRISGFPLPLLFLFLSLLFYISIQFHQKTENKLIF